MIKLTKKRKYNGLETYLIEATTCGGKIYLPEGLPDFLAEDSKQAIIAATDPRSNGAATMFRLNIKVKDNKMFSLDIREGMI